LEPLTAEYGVSFGRRQVFDPNHISGASKYASFVIEQGWADHPAVRSLVMQPVAFFDVRELSVGRDAVALAWTSAQGWAEPALEHFVTHGQLGVDEGVDRYGESPVIAAGERGESRMIVVASAGFALNAWLREDIAYSRGR